MYTPLDPGRKEIRLLRITPSVDHAAQISCSIVIAGLQGPPPHYAALSYVWGDAKVTEEIRVDGEPFQATKNLALALRQFRESYAKEDGETLHLWADAVCINQQDLPERGQQVAMMGLIYTTAHWVISWLGPSEDATEPGFALIKACARHVEGVREKNGVYPESDVAMDTSDLEFLGGNREFYEQTTDRYARNKAWNAIDDLKRNVYWTRVWIVQEIVLARRPDANILFCGRHSLSFQQLADFNLFAARSLAQKPLKPPFFDQRVWDWVVKDQDLTAGFIMYVHGLRDFRTRGEYRLIPLINTSCRSTDPRDAVFGLAGLFGGEIVPDYSKGVADVFRECVATVLRLKNYRGFFSFAGLIREHRDVSEFPSWVPKFHTNDADFAIFATDMAARPWLEGLCPAGPTILDERTMRFYGVRLDQCARVLRHVGGAEDFFESLWRFWWICLTFVRDYGTEYPRDGLRALEDLLHAFSRGRDARGEPLQIDPSIQCIASHAFRILLRFGEPQDGDETAVRRWRALGYGSLEEVRAALDEALVGSGAPDVSTFGTTLPDEKYEEIFNAVNVMNDMVLKWVGSPLFRTEKGHMGLAPPAAAEGDIVCLLDGFSIPCLLRRHGRDHYVLVGSCYVTGYSHEEFLEPLRKGNLSIEEFRIR
ncbi:heterokaryon incompatibility protein-domain-containing protein [Apiospora marii]|uniref:Heterokaryon incompatibility protein-domain-containing protein n=1 Tax=Apiospora marii TaxID=335849 RepID=A0ABR1STC4_9PEZI